jgi:hypothetical protein
VKSAAARVGEGGAGDGKFGRRCSDINQAAAELIPAATWTRWSEPSAEEITAAVQPRGSSVGSGVEAETAITGVEQHRSRRPEAVDRAEVARGHEKPREGEGRREVGAGEG